MKTILAIVVWAFCMAVPAVHAQQVYKCIDAKGQASFQQHPCIGQGAPIEVRPANTIEGRPAGDARLRAQAERSIAINTAISTGALVNGMTEQEMFQVLGRPSTINTDVINGRANRQYVYRYSDGSTRYVYINETGVYALQERPSVASPATQPCYGELELRNAQMETTARFVSEEQRARRIERYRSMLACRR